MTEGREDPAVMEFESASRHYSRGWRDSVPALAELSLRVGRGRICALIGPNGSGKSTALKLAAGLLEPGAGRVRVCGFDAATVAARRRIGYLPESVEFPAWQTVGEFLTGCGRLSGLSSRSCDSAIESRLNWAGLDLLRDRRVRQMSNGQRQRLGLVQALLHEPEVVLLDEPASGLDPIGVGDLAALLRDLRGAGRTVLLSSHFLPQVEEVCDHVVLLNAGRAIWSGAPGASGELERRFAAIVRAAA